MYRLFYIHMCMHMSRCKCLDTRAICRRYIVSTLHVDVVVASVLLHMRTRTHLPTSMRTYIRAYIHACTCIRFWHQDFGFVFVFACAEGGFGRGFAAQVYGLG